ncbi:MAG: hypothetical protein AAF447_18280 [Myxococcota bacterium]
MGDELLAELSQRMVGSRAVTPELRRTLDLALEPLQTGRRPRTVTRHFGFGVFTPSEAAHGHYGKVTPLAGWFWIEGGDSQRTPGGFFEPTRTQFKLLVRLGPDRAPHAV